MEKPIDVVVMGSEESCVSTDFGYRPLLFAKGLSRLKGVGKVMIVNCPVSFPRRVAGRLCRNKEIGGAAPIVLKKSGAVAGKVTEKLYWLNLTLFFPDKGGFFTGRNTDRLVKTIPDILKTLGFEDFVLWITAPRMVAAGSRIDSKIKIFDAIDDMLAHPQMRAFHQRIREAYRWAEDYADLITIAAEGQREMFSRRSKLFLLPNGVDDIFLSHLETGAPDAIKGFPKPIVGYVGVLQDRFDVGLMEDVVKRLGDCRFVFVGPVQDPAYFQPLSRYKNVHFLGRKRYSEIPAYVRHFDVAIIPHKVNSFTESMNPLKIYEYLGSGKPVVSTPVAGTEIFRDFIYTAGDAATFSDLIRKALRENGPQAERMRRQAVLRHTLEARAQSLLDKIGDMNRRRGERI